MNALCPFCLNEDDSRPTCDECGGSGALTIDIAEGALYTMRCKSPDCGFENGGRIVGPGLLPIEGDETVVRVCIVCGFGADYELVTWVSSPEDLGIGE